MRSTGQVHHLDTAEDEALRAAANIASARRSSVAFGRNYSAYQELCRQTGKQKIAFNSDTIAAAIRNSTDDELASIYHAARMGILSYLGAAARDSSFSINFGDSLTADDRPITLGVRTVGKHSFTMERLTPVNGHYRWSLINWEMQPLAVFADPGCLAALRHELTGRLVMYAPPPPRIGTISNGESDFEDEDEGKERRKIEL